MPLGPEDQEKWGNLVIELARLPKLDVVERIATDARIVFAVRYLNGLEDMRYDYDVHDTLALLLSEYCVDSEVMDAALELAEDRIMHDQA